MKNRANPFFALFFLVLFISMEENIYGQTTRENLGQKNEFSISLGGPFSSLDYELKGGDPVHNTGIVFGAQYARYLNENWSISAGVEYQSYEAVGNIPQLAGSYHSIDSEGEEFEFRYVAQNYREQQNLSYLQLPLTVRFETLGTVRFYVSAGGKIGIPLKSTYEVRAGNLSTSGYYPQYNVELFDPLFMGLGNFGRQKKPELDLDTNMAYSISIETGIKQTLEEKGSFYIGLYLDYGLNEVIDATNEKHVIGYNPENPTNFSFNSFFESGYAENSKLMSYGVKIRYCIGVW